MTTMRVALISFHYPPDPAVGSLRAAKVAEAFREAGHDVHVVAAQVPEASAPISLSPSGVRIERVRLWRHPRDLWQALKARGRPAGPEVKSGESTYAIPVAVPGWKRHIFSLLWLPDDAQGFIVPAIRAARAAFPDGIDLIYTSAPPFSAHLVGLWLARGGPRWLAEFRDPWTDNAWKPSHVRSAWSDAIERWLERRTLATAHRIVAVSQGIARLITAKLPAGSHDRVLLVRNGIQQLDTHEPKTSQSEATPKPRRIVHVGSFYFGRDPRPFLVGLAEVLRRHSLGAGEVRVDLVGHCRWYNGVSIEAAAAEMGLADVVSFQDWVPHDTCQRIVREADALLLLAQDQPDQVPNKLYEYLGARKRILAFADSEGETAQLLAEAGTHTVVTTNNVDEAALAIATVLGLTPAVQQSANNDSWLRTLTTAAQMRRLLDAVGDAPDAA